MKEMKTFQVMEARTATLLLALAVGLALAVHEFFLFVALGVMLLVAAEWTVQEGEKYLRYFRMRRKIREEDSVEERASGKE
jgi:hypothetical protein